MPVPILPLNAVIGKCRIERLVGSGGMGEVYRAINLQTKMPVAVKALTGAGEPGTALARFRNEAVIQYNLRHPNVAELYEYFEYHGTPCIVMEFVEGSTLNEWIRETGPLAVPRALEILADICDAVSYMHSRGTIHRDIKSENIRVNAQGKAKLLDFGISISKSTPAFTRVGCVVGTPEKMAPEQHLGLRGDARSDVWALGVLLYEMVTGVPPFTSSSPVGLREDILALRYIPASRRKTGLPRRVRRMIENCLRLKPEDRYASSGVMLREVQQVRRRLSGPLWRRDLSAGPAIVTGGLAVLGLLLLLHAINPAPDARTSDASGQPASPPVAAAPSRTEGTEPPAFREATPAPQSKKAPSPHPLHASSPASAPAPAMAPPRESESGLSGTDQRTIRVATYDGPAEVTNKEGQVLGSTPYPVTGPMGNTYELWLRRPGYQPRKVDVQINVNKTEYLFGLEKREKE